MIIVRFALVGLSLAFLPGCASLVLVQGPQPVGHPDREASSETCTTSKQWIAMDGVVGGALALTAVTALASGENSEGVSNFEDWFNLKPGPTAAVGGVLAGVALWSARRGSGRVNDCRDLRLQLGVAQQATRESWSSANRWHRPPLDIPAVP